MLGTVKPYYHKDDVVDFVTSDGKVFQNGVQANKHEMMLRLEHKLGDIAINTKRICGGHDYILDHHKILRRGVYNIEVENDDDMEMLEYFFKGIDEALGYPTVFPFTFCLDIYYDKIPGVIVQHAQWRLYDKENYQK